MIPPLDLSGKQKLFKCDPLMGLCEISMEVIHRKTKAPNCVTSTLEQTLGELCPITVLHHNKQLTPTGPGNPVHSSS